SDQPLLRTRSALPRTPHYEQMLANGGTLFGKRLLSAESVAAMSSNQVGGLYQVNGKQAGRGFGYGVAVVLDPAAANSARGKGAFGWGGAFGTTTWTDPEHEITAVLMVQQASARVLHDFEHAIRAAIVD
ncbi:MAG: serine hydrolase, partial [Spirochaetaceae bacterium]|nr:serine hydrolase [Spirochaetaceae bacterium]